MCKCDCHVCETPSKGGVFQPYEIEVDGVVILITPKES